MKSTSLRRRTSIAIFFIASGLFHLLCQNTTQNPFNSDSILHKAIKVDDHIRITVYPDYWKPTYVGKSRPSNIWTRGVFYEGHMALYGICPDTALYNYALNWAKYHNWEMAYKQNTTTNADNQCCAQTYLELYQIDPSAEKIKTVKSCIDYNIGTKDFSLWTWIDAIQMSMPVYAYLGKITGDTVYYGHMHRLYEYSKTGQDMIGFYNASDGLWWRDKDFNAPYLNVNGKQCYWSRGDGWVYAALVRVLNVIPEKETNHDEYLGDYLAMTDALVKCQRSDGFWNPSLIDSTEYGGKETSGTALFVYGLAWGINKGILKGDKYLNAARKGWIAISKEAIHEDGFLGWIQGTGKQPCDSQPLSYDKVPDFQDFGAGCVLLAAAESYKLALSLESATSERRITDISHKNIRLLSYGNNLKLISENPVFAELRIYSVTGKLIIVKNLTGQKNFTVDLRNLPSGLYIAVCRTSEATCQIKFAK